MNKKHIKTSILAIGILGFVFIFSGCSNENPQTNEQQPATQSQKESTSVKTQADSTSTSTEDSLDKPLPENSKEAIDQELDAINESISEEFEASLDDLDNIEKSL